jgi:hypothetical protein
MATQQYAGDGDHLVRRYEYEDGWIVAADVGISADRLEVDVVDGTAIVVVDGRTEAEFDLPGAADDVDTNNGVLVVRGEA